jgi:hypothetical protein
MQLRVKSGRISDNSPAVNLLFTLRFYEYADFFYSSRRSLFGYF